MQLKKYYVTAHAFNQANYPDMVGKMFAMPPAHARVRTVITCCGDDLICWDFTNTCSTCDADYNSSGQRLAPRAQWGEETGEHWSDCL